MEGIKVISRPWYIYPSEVPEQWVPVPPFSTVSLIRVVPAEHAVVAEGLITARRLENKPQQPPNLLCG